jgi:hypothetical protein
MPGEQLGLLHDGAGQWSLLDAVDVQAADGALGEGHPDRDDVPDTGASGHPGELPVRRVLLAAVDDDGLPGLRGVQARAEPRLVLPLVQVHGQRAGEDHAARTPVLDHGEGHVLDADEGLLGQLGDPPQGLLRRIGGYHDPGELGQGQERVRAARRGGG